jgi:hypothetical protein
MSGQQVPFVASPRGYWQLDGAIRWAKDGRLTRWTEVVLGDSFDDPRAELVSLNVVEESAPGDTPR